MFGLGERPVGTSGTTGRMGKATVQGARGEFLHLDQRRRRYLIHLPTAEFSGRSRAAGAVARRGTTGRRGSSAAAAVTSG